MCSSDLERLDQEVERGVLLVVQAQGERLLMQVGRQCDPFARKVDGARPFLVAARVLAGRRLAAPLAVVRAEVDRAVAQREGGVIIYLEIFRS